MKTIFSITCAFLLSTIVTAQQYEIKAVNALAPQIGLSTKVRYLQYEGSVTVTDSLLIVKLETQKGKFATADYDIKSSRNGKTYVTDGVVTYEAVIAPYDQEIYLYYLDGMKFKKIKKPITTTYMFSIKNVDAAADHEIFYYMVEKESEPED